MKQEEFNIMDLNQKDDEAENGASQGEAVFRISSSEEDKKKDAKEDEEKVDWKKEAVSLFITLGITLAVIFVLKNYVIINANVPTGSMENTIMPDDNIFGFRLAYLTKEPERGDVIFFYFPDDESQKYVKRIIGLPGETIYIDGGKIYINGSDTPLEEPYLKEEWTQGTGPYYFEIPENSYFCLGDNRNGSSDARYWKNTYVTKEKIIGKAIFIYFPIDRWGMIE